ncbi:glycosyltransferase [Microbulbifer sp.]|uniref:glycosyltransferase n=1 Tax=Microbulbifer sp. TaxID=1908541 RepID=UPI003F31E804
MRITIFSIGTQGDVRPFVALGRGLQRAGHRVRIASGRTCERLVTGQGLEFSPLSADFLDIMARDPGALRRGLNPLALLATARRELRAMAVDWAEQGRAATADADLLLGNGMVAPLAASLGEVVGRPVVETHLQPITPCPDIPPMMLPPPRKPRPGAVNRLLYHCCRLLTWQMLSPAYARVRRDLDLPPFPRRGPTYSPGRRYQRLLYGFSPLLVPPSSHWPASVRVAGNWFLEEGRDWRPPAALADFLEAGPKPVYVGFGSMCSEDAATFTRVILEALRRSGRRAVLATGWGGLSEEVAESVAGDRNILAIEAAPHDWLLPRVALAVHHGGAGTTAATLRAGIPSVVVPFFGDQPFWAWRLEQLGVAPPALKRRGLTSAALYAGIRQGLSEPMRQRAAELGGYLRAEDGVANAIAQLQSWELLPPAAPGDEFPPQNSPDQFTAATATRLLPT